MPKTTTQSASSAGHDRSLLEWFATLTPEQRLAELESRIGFFLSFDELDARYREHQSTIKPTNEDILAGAHLVTKIANSNAMYHPRV